MRIRLARLGCGPCRTPRKTWTGEESGRTGPADEGPVTHSTLLGLISTLRNIP
jgi:hypothetical protein